MQYVDLVWNLIELKFSDIVIWVSGVWSKISNPVTTITQFNEWVKKIYDKLEHLEAYYYGYGSAYIWANVSFIALDPAWKITKLANLEKVVWKIDDVIKWLIYELLNSKIASLWTEEFGRI